MAINPQKTVAAFVVEFQTTTTVSEPLDLLDDEENEEDEEDEEDINEPIGE